MAISSSKTTVLANVAAVKITPALLGPSKVAINVDGGGLIVGGPGVTQATGFNVRPGSYTLDLTSGDEIWAVATTPTVVSVLTKT